MLYPLKFDKVLKEKPWGGHQFANKLHIPLPTTHLYGESWEIASHDNGMSVVKNGDLKGATLEKLLLRFKYRLVGKTLYKKYGGRFPLIIKFLDINDKLSVQVHPDDEYAFDEEEQPGKTESWFVIDCKPKSKMILGLKKGVNEKILRKAIKKEKFDDIYNIVELHKGDFLTVKPGTVHGSLEDSILICEIQENSDVTYRIFDYNRLFNGKKRELHIDKACEVIDFNIKPDLNDEVHRKHLITPDYEVQKLIDGYYYKILEFDLYGEYLDEQLDRFRIYTFIDGEFTIKYDNDEIYCHGGESLFIPAYLKIIIVGEGKYLHITAN